MFCIALESEAVVRRCSVKKVFFRNFARFTGKHLCRSLLFNKVAVLRPETLLKRRLWQRCFPMNFVKFLKTPFLLSKSIDWFLCDGNFNELIKVILATLLYQLFSFFHGYCLDLQLDYKWLHCRCFSFNLFEIFHTSFF